jgi:hypothetical protein
MPDAPSLADAHDEANILRAAINYRRDGLLSNAGLPNFGGSHAFGRGTCQIASLDQARQELTKVGGEAWNGRPDADVVSEYQRLTKRQVVNQPTETLACPVEIYTHYPAGTHLLAGLFLHVLPLDGIWLLRLVPLTLTFLSLAWLLWEFRHRFGYVLAAFVGVAIASCGALRLFSHNLYYHGYATGLLFLSVAATLMALRNCGSPRARRWASILIAVAAFLQGFLSLDFFFLVVLAPLPFLLFERRLNREAVVLFSVVPLLAFGAAQALHLLQVAIHHGSLTTALGDLVGSALGRSLGPYGDFSGELPSYGALALRYLQDFVFSPNAFFGWALPVTLLVFIAHLFVYNTMSLEAKHQALRALTAMLMAILASSLWVLVMRQHAVVHTHILPRHYLLLFTVALYLEAHLLRSLLSEATTSAWPIPQLARLVESHRVVRVA